MKGNVEDEAGLAQRSRKHIEIERSRIGFSPRNFLYCPSVKMLKIQINLSPAIQYGNYGFKVRIIQRETGRKVEVKHLVCSNEN